jgi:hypothetical protein
MRWEIRRAGGGTGPTVFLAFRLSAPCQCIDGLEQAGPQNGPCAKSPQRAHAQRVEIETVNRDTPAGSRLRIIFLPDLRG